MRCEDCLPLIEEYFDGEVTGQTAGQVSAHLSVCADCAAALDALSFEQEIYARYDRGGLEVTPDLWARVSAEIARTPLPESPAAERPFLSRARDYFAAACGALAVRPALASSLSLFVVAAAAGALWLSRRPAQPEAPARQQVAVNTQAPAAETFKSVVPEEGGVNVTPAAGGSLNVNEGDALPAAFEPRPAAREVAADYGTVEIAPERAAAEDAVAKMLEPAAAPPPANTGLVVLQPEEAAPVDETAALVNAAAPAGERVAQPARLLDPEEKDVARHVERAQALLRSIKNVRASEAGDSDIAYEKDLSRKLLAENATLQLEAEFKGDRESQQVLDRIEPFLLEIANMGEKPSREEVRSIRERVRSNEIVAALEVY